MEEIKLLFSIEDMTSFLKSLGYEVKKLEVLSRDKLYHQSVLAAWKSNEVNINEAVKLGIDSVTSSFGVKNQFIKELKRKLLF